MSQVSFTAQVVDAGGGHVDLLVSRDTMSYPPIGEAVTVTYDDGATYFIAHFDDEWWVMTRAGRVASFFGGNKYGRLTAEQYAQEHADRLNREATS